MRIAPKHLPKKYASDYSPLWLLVPLVLSATLLAISLLLSELDDSSRALPAANGSGHEAPQPIEPSGA